ncbi:chemotaxis protein [Vibrio aestuarianus]|uniref:Chemotaxis protein n=1 Tax=Vibrio aestuarianus TaxID=28171 RepID=A0A9X4FE67_9VIBR|nr:chemotaxis protein [Vibrio aestuarianus]MDE1234729.1 chemotaxis protein [Vibrio aestuarianus]MDE1245491.1 chemotaxis protein [Vibrio aestuarianus]MDE1346491.1 chemotaxis protein [Vibrio aestuarianus]NGZ62809.1 chemotaxis protein [Vibrio aestuarianus subsp. cardii]
MEITLELLFWTLVGCAGLVVLLQAISINKEHQMQQWALDEAERVNARFDQHCAQMDRQAVELSQQLSDKTDQLLSVMKTAAGDTIQHVTAEVNQQGEQVIARLSAAEKEVVSQLTQLSLQLAAAEAEQKGAALALEQRLQEQHTSTGACLSAIQSNQERTDDLIVQQAAEQQRQIAALHALSEEQHQESRNLHSELARTQAERTQSLVKKQSEEFTKVQKLVGQSHSSLKALLQTLKQLDEKRDFATKQAGIAQLEQLTTQIQQLRADNLVSLTNELARHQELTIDTDDFVKRLGDCKVTQIEDKHSGQVTHIYYENGKKRSSDTFAGNQLKYQMTFNHDGKPVRGCEFDQAGNLVFEYLYDDAGEISKRIETVYDPKGNEEQKLETAY